MRKADYADYNWMKAPLAPITIAFILGIVCAPTGVPLSLLIGAALLTGAVALRARSSRIGLAAVLGFWVLLGATRMGAWMAHPDHRLAARLTEEPAPVQLHGIVADDPSPALDHSAPAQTAVVRLLHERDRSGWRPISGRVRASFHDPLTPVSYGDEVVLEGEWSRVPSPGNPGQYDWRAALARRRVHGLLTVRPYHGVAILRRGGGHPAMAAVFRWRRRWQRLIESAFPPEQAGLLRSLLLGQRVALDEQIQRAFVETGTVHLLVISGFNVGLIAAVIEMGLRLLGMAWRWRLAVSAAALGGYCLLTGMQPPVARATVMAWLVLGGFSLDRVISWPNILAAAALLILWINPTQIRDPGFQLSFGAVASLLLLMPRWQGRLEACAGWVRPGWVRRYVALSCGSTAAVWVGLTPILAWYFHLVSPISMAANLLIAPPMTALITLGTLMLLLASAAEPVMGLFRPVVSCTLQLTVHAVRWCHAVPGGSWWVGQPGMAWVVVYYGLVIATLMRQPLRLSRRQMLGGWLVAAMVWGLSGWAARRIAPRWLEVQVLDVGHGDAIVIRAPSGRTYLVDAGTEEAGRHRVIPYLQHAGCSTLESVILTHPDADHIGGAPAVLDRLRVRRLLTNGVRDDTMSARRVRETARQRRIPHVVATAGFVVEKQEDFRIEVIHPPPGLVLEAAPESNDNSIVLRLVYGSITMLLTGDLEEAGLPWLLGREPSLQAAVLKVPHHGSRLGEAGDRFIDAVRPRIAVLSVGRLHHLPSRDIVQALERAGAQIYSTRDDGAIRVRTDGTRLDVTTFRGEPW